MKISDIKQNFTGVLVIGDVHGDYSRFEQAAEYASEQNLLLASLGDLVDRGPLPFEVVSHMHRLMMDGCAIMNIGNHDDKFRRYASGAKVKFSRDGRETLDAVGEDRLSEFLKMYTEIMSHENAALYHDFRDIVLVHGASDRSIWDGSGKDDTKSARSRFLYGEVNGEIDEDGYPVRLYNWIDEVPGGVTVIAGHDRKAVHNQLLTKPLVVKNRFDGAVVFLDTSCGKGGFLSGAVLKFGDTTYIDKLVEFK